MREVGNTQYQPLNLLLTLNHKEGCINKKIDNSHQKLCWIFHLVLTTKKSSNLKHKWLNWLELELSVYCDVLLIYEYSILWNIITTMDIHMYGNIQACFKSVNLYYINKNIHITPLLWFLGWWNKIEQSKVPFKTLKQLFYGCLLVDI